MTGRPAMIMPYIVDGRVGDGYRPAFILDARADAVRLYVTSKLAIVTVPKATVEKARVVSYQPRGVRKRLLAQVRLYRKQGRRFPREATVALLRRLGVASAAIDETVTVAPLPEVVAMRERRAMRVERAVEMAAVATATREKIDLQLAEPQRVLTRPCARRQRYAHPDQLALAF